MINELNQFVELYEKEIFDPRCFHIRITELTNEEFNEGVIHAITHLIVNGYGKIKNYIKSSSALFSYYLASCIAAGNLEYKPTTGIKYEEPPLYTPERLYYNPRGLFGKKITKEEFTEFLASLLLILENEGYTWCKCKAGVGGHKESSFKVFLGFDLNYEINISNDPKVDLFKEPYKHCIPPEIEGESVKVVLERWEEKVNESELMNKSNNYLYDCTSIKIS